MRHRKVSSRNPLTACMELLPPFANRAFSEVKLQLQLAKKLCRKLSGFLWRTANVSY